VTSPGGGDATKSSDDKMTPMRRMMWGAATIHVLSGLAATIVYMGGGFFSDGFRGLAVLAIVGGFWTIWAKNEDQQDRDAWLFRMPTQQNSGPKTFSDFRDDTRGPRA